MEGFQDTTTVSLPVTLVDTPVGATGPEWTGGYLPYKQVDQVGFSGATTD